MSPKIKDVAARIRPIGRIESSVNSSKYAKTATEAILTDLESLGFVDVKGKPDGSGDLILSARHADPEIQKRLSDAILPEMMYRYTFEYGQVILRPYSWSSMRRRKFYHRTSSTRYCADEFGDDHGRVRHRRDERRDELVIWEAPNAKAEQERRKGDRITAEMREHRERVRGYLQSAAGHIGAALEERRRFREEWAEELPVTQATATYYPDREKDAQRLVSVVIKDGEIIVATGVKP